MRAKVWGLRILFLLGLFSTWFFLSGPGGVSAVLLPRPESVLTALGELVQDSQFWPALGVTSLEIVLGFVIAALAGIYVGFVSSRTMLRGRILEPLLAWGYMVPIVLFYPLFILWFDIGIWSKVLFAALSAFIPITFTSLRGFRAVDPKYLRVARAFGASRGQADRQVKFMAALPIVMASLRLGAASTIIAVILAEMIAATRGLGYELTYSSLTLDVPRVYALIVVVLVLVGLLQLAINRLSHTRRRRSAQA